MKIQLKRSDVLASGKAKEPTPGNMKDGELAINYSALDPSFFIKDSNGTIRKLGINDVTNVQSDWAETNPNSPAYIKNKQLVTQELSDLQDQIDLKIEDAPNNQQYGRVKGAWTLIEVLEANKDGNGYVRKDGGWYDISQYDYATTTYVNDTAEAAGLLAVATANAYTDAAIITLNDTIYGEGFVKEAPDNNLYIRQGPGSGQTVGSWQAFPAIVEEAPGDGVGYLRRNQDWEDVDDYLTLNTDFLKDAQATGQVFGRQNNQWVEIVPPDAGVTSFNGRTGTVVPMSDDYAAYYTSQDWVTSQGYATQSWVTTQNFATQSWVINQGYITLADVPTQPPVDLSGYVTLGTDQSISGYKNFTNYLRFNGSHGFKGVGSGFRFMQDGTTGSAGSGTGGGIFQWVSNNVRIGIRSDTPSAALDVQAGMRARQYLNNDSNGNPTRNVVWDGRLFIAEDGIDFRYETRFHGQVVQESKTVYRILDSSSAAVASISTAERAVATRLRHALRGYVVNGKRGFNIDKQSLMSAFTDEGLDINDYDIMQTVTQPLHEGFVSEEDELNYAGYAEETYSAVDYQSLFAFCLAAGPDLSALETRIAALETPIAVDGYYPLYTTEAAANANGDGTSHSHTFYGITYYMPNGVTYYHGNYTG